MTDLATDWYGGHIATFGDRLAAARDAAQLSQQQLSKHLGVRLKTLKSWENDSSEPRSNKLSMIAGVLNVSLIWLLTCLLYTSPSPRDVEESRMPSSA